MTPFVSVSWLFSIFPSHSGAFHLTVPFRATGSAVTRWRPIGVDTGEKDLHTISVTHRPVT
jgi:hypothetical protein